MVTTDLRAVDDLCRLARAARRVGCRIHLADADPQLRQLLELAGVGDVLSRCPAEGSPRGSDHNAGDLP